MKNNYEVLGETTVIYIYCKSEYHECLVDTSDLDKLMAIDAKWTGLMEGHSIYAIANIIVDGKRTTLRMHRYLTGANKTSVVDHANHNGLDNRSFNINVVGKSENAQNMSKLRSDNTSGHRGVTWHKQRQKWNAQISIDGQHISGGLYEYLEDAIEASEILMQTYFPYLEQIARPKDNPPTEVPSE